MIGTILVIFGVLGIAGAVLGKDFRVADPETLIETKQKMPTWLGRLLWAVVGTGMIGIGIKMQVDGK